MKSEVRANMAISPLRLLTVVLRVWRKGIVANWDAPLMSPLIMMLGNSFCMRIVGA